MKLFQLTAVTVVLALAGGVRAETKVELKGTHLCCDNCVKAVGQVLTKQDGVADAKCDKKAGTVSFTAKDDATAKKAIQALADAGFHGDTGNKDLAIKDDSGVTKGKVKSLTLTGLHNCCDSCAKSINNTLKKVDGVKTEPVEKKVTTIEVTGEFDAEALVKAFNDAGYHVKVKK
jgi:copper chaperone CopZ